MIGIRCSACNIVVRSADLRKFEGTTGVTETTHIYLGQPI